MKYINQWKKAKEKMTPEKALKTILGQYEKDEIVDMFMEFIDTFAGTQEVNDYLDAIAPDWKEDMEELED